MKLTKHIKSLIANGVSAPRPVMPKPMLCTLIREPFNDSDWIYEVKWDGYRIMATIDKGRVTLTTRGAQNYTAKYRQVADALSSLKMDMVLDGEVIVIDEDGKPDFDALQRYNPSMMLTYFVFDIIWLDGYSLVDLPLYERREILEAVLPANMVYRISEQFDDGEKLFSRMKEAGMEGIVAKKRNSVYLPGKRSNDWLKLQTEIRGEYVVGGYTESNSSRPFRSLLFGNYQDGKLVYVGNAGGGYKESEMNSILSKLKQLEIGQSPFTNKPKVDRKTHWVKPELVANFKFATFTDAGVVRKPAIFLGFRDDKPARKVVPELAKTLSKKQPPATDRGSGKSNWSILHKEKITSRADFVIDDKKFELTNVEKELWKGIHKAELIDYYHSVAPYILPHLKDRPLSLHIKNNGAMAPGFYIKDMEGNQPRWAEIFAIGRKHKVKGKSAVINYLVCQDEPTLLYAVNLGCIDINPWTSRASNPFSPDYVIIDLDPSDNDFAKAVEAGKAVKQVLDKYKVKGFAKTSGKTGIHIYLPVEGITFSQARSIATALCDEVHKLVPAITTTEVSVGKRGNLLYLDPNQNDQADTVAAPYSVRPNTKPTVSTPIDWRELNSRLDPYSFDIYSIPKRLQKKGDLFKDTISGKYNASNTKKLLKLL